MSDYNNMEGVDGAEREAQNAPVPPPEPPVQQQTQYWSTRDAQQSSGGTPGQSHRPPYYGGQQPYQYNANTGWQQSPNWNSASPSAPGGEKPKKKRRKLVVISVVTLCAIFAVLIGFSAVKIYDAMTQPPAPVTQNIPGPWDDGDEGTAGDAGDPNTVAANANSSGIELASKPEDGSSQSVDGKMSTPDIAEKVLPSVVSIENYQNGQFIEAYGLGSGIIMNTDGYVITNAHVIEGAEALKVTLYNGESYQAQLIGEDERTDLAVIKITAQNLVPAEFGDSDELRVGETVIAIGNPASLELAGSVTQGIVSAVNRTVQTTTYAMTYIQTDAAINPGNSGGALVNEYGQIIGINTSKIVASGFEGIGFAIPITDAKPVLEDLIDHGRVTGRVRLGITAQAIDALAADRLGLPKGLQIVSIDDDSDMGAKGVQVNDIITHVEGTRVSTFTELSVALDGYKAGDQVQLTLYRQSSAANGNTYNVTITLLEDKG